MVLAESQQPSLTLAVRLDVGAGHVLGLIAQHLGVLRPLQQGDLGGGVAGRDCTDLTGLDDGDPVSGPSQQQSGGETGDPGAHDDLVNRPFGEGIVGQGGRVVEPQRSHRQKVPESVGVHASGEPAKAQLLKRLSRSPAMWSASFW